jgi:glycosyltransferase involved in cell wall biosynthesis
MKNILVVGPYPPPYGGIATLVAGVTPYLAQQGYHITVLSLTTGKEEQFSPHQHVEVLRRNGRKLLMQPGSLAAFLRRRQKFHRADVEWLGREIITTNAVRRLIRERNISLVSSYMITSSMFVPRLKQQFGEKVKFATTIFGEMIERGDIIQRNRAFYRSILDSSDQVLATSKYCASLAGEVGYDATKVKVIYIGVDSSALGDASASKPEGANVNLPPDKRKVLFLGRFHQEMGLDVVMDSIPQVVAARPDTCFLLVGARGPLSPAAAKLGEAYPNNVMVHQNAPFNMLPFYYSNAEILLAPTADQHACMGVSIKEGMAAGKAIITTNSGGVPEAVVHGESGVVLDLQRQARLDPGKLTTSIVELLDDPQRVAGFGQKAKQRAVEIFDNSICLPQHLEVVRRLIGDP